MIELDQVMPLLLEACPAFQETWDAHCDYWYGKLGISEANHYIDIGAYARFLLDSASGGKTTCFPAVFAVVEKLLVEGSDSVRTLMVTGLLEGLQNMALNSGKDYSAFLPWLGSNARKYWLGLAQFWGN